MRRYIKRSERAAVMLFRRGSSADEARMDAIEAQHADIAQSVYSGLLSGLTDYAYIKHGKHLIVYHRSTRGEFVQASHFTYFNGEPEAVMHTDVTDAKKLADTLIPGTYINIVA